MVEQSGEDVFIQVHMHCQGCACDILGPESPYVTCSTKFSSKLSLMPYSLPLHGNACWVFRAAADRWKSRRFRFSHRSRFKVTSEGEGEGSRRVGAQKASYVWGQRVVGLIQVPGRYSTDKLSACLRGFDGVEEVEIDREDHKVIARGENVDPLMVLEMVRKKHYSNVELISPRITEIEEPEPQPEEPKEIPIKIFVLEVPMHCQKCAIDIRTKLFEIEGVLTMEPNIEEGSVIVKGEVEAVILGEHIKRKLRKHAEVVSEELAVPDEKKKRKEEEEQAMAMVVFHYPPRCCFNHNFYPCESFNDENVQSCLIM